MKEPKVRILDGFPISAGSVSADDSKSRIRKMWLLLSYFIYHRQRSISQEELYRLPWGDEESKDNPQNALRVMLHRTRALQGVGGELCAAHNL